MSESLDFSQEEFKELLRKTSEMVTEVYSDLENQKGYHHFEQSEVEGWFDEPLPLEGMDTDKLFSLVKQKVIDPATGNLGPNMFAYVISGGNQISTIADFLASTINQNPTKWHLGPSMTEIEKRVVKWTAEIVGFTPEAGGAMVSGGSAATLAGLTVARSAFFRKTDLNKTGLFGLKPFTLYCSRETHSCADKSVSLLGIGTNQLRKINTHPDFTIDLEDLERQVSADLAAGFTPFCVIGNAGTVNTGAIDDLKGISAIAKKYGMWFHIDGAYGGLASALPSLKNKYSGIELADSVALDFHKWLYQPFEIGCVLVRDWKFLRDTYYKKADYLSTEFEENYDRLEFHEHYFQLSRNAKAFKVWMSLKAYGFARIREMIQKDIDLTRYLEKLISESDDFELKSSSDLAVACFRYTGGCSSEEEIVAVNEKLIEALEKDGRIFLTGTKLNDEFVLRACLINHRKTQSSVDYFLHTIREVASEIK